MRLSVQQKSGIVRDMPGAGTRPVRVRPAFGAGRSRAGRYVATMADQMTRGDGRGGPPPTLAFSTDGLPDEQAFSEWRGLLAPMVRVERARGGPTPRGTLACTLLDGVLFSRMTFNAQVMIRDRVSAASTPDHFTMMLYPVGGLEGVLAGQAVVRQPNRVMAVDMAKQMHMRGAPSSAFGLTIPRALLTGVDPATAPVRLDPERNRLLVARLVALCRQIREPGTDDAAALASDVLGFVRRLYDPSGCRDVLEGAELDAGLVELAERVIARNLSAPDLTPAFIAGRLGVSRATLYRAFDRSGGIMRRVWEMRLAAMRAALADPFELRSLERLALDCGFRSVSHMSRSFRDLFGDTPAAWRRERARRAPSASRPDRGLAHRWYDELEDTVPRSRP